ncbi:MAG: SPOR domain-containing protein [Flavobacteriales bacterium]|nr:SPOR domain-containing protein [Flavobacteriales bacterium]MCW8913411.1 SPOR domain-containing protein [Flavobacteriales bacterium]MCW8938525.1 SPOR domain-containing protein [Flavobacteriales bacterium]MCW8969508.1 SPOR domain-containing protein [Flavobacteriales bacterium]MCW8990252.1 SPOR domain-containing protein [Flavobacteriales bacterium]
MNKYSLLFICVLLLGSLQIFAQSDSTSITSPKLPETTISKAPINPFSPTIGLGVGNFKFYGDILDANVGTPFISNIAYDLHIKQRLNHYLALKFYVLFGKVSANERSLDRNLNFESRLSVGGFALMYDFGNFLPKKRSLSPFLSLGFESVEFHSKTDMFDEFGNRYNYWSDGSIRNLPQHAPNAQEAIVIQRDYVFETDIRESDFDGLGKYPERTFAIPFGGGVIMHATENIDFTLGFIMHFTFSDLVDGVVEESEGDRIGNQPGNGSNDKFLMSSFSISYNFMKHKKDYEIKDFEAPIDYLAYDMDDEDGDGVIDFMDECAWTPAGVEVDEKGCPLDMDKDFVPNYKDDELESRPNAFVTPAGVEMTDEMIKEAYDRYMDTTGAFATIENRSITAGKKSKVQPKKYKVQLGRFTEAIDAALVDKFLSVSDVEIQEKNGETIITVGDYMSLNEAVQRKASLTRDGFEAAIVVEETKDGNLVSVGDEANNMAIGDEFTSMENTDKVVFRVQLGAFSKKQPKELFSNLDGVIELKADDGLYKYMAPGAYSTIEEAAKQKINLALDNGIKDAFVVAYQGGKRITLKEAGVLSAAQESIKTKSKTYDKNNIVYKVQIGSYKNQLPVEVLTKFMKIKGVEQTEIDNELTRYTTGSFKTYDEAQAYKTIITDENGISGAFVIALHGDELIPVNQARELLGE